MKNINKICVLFFILISISATGFTQETDTLNLPGANLNLYGVLYLFKESNSLAEFEKKLNTPDNRVNNLDLDNDGLIDYIRVSDYTENGIHSIVLQDPISEAEAQDLAVIEIEQRGNNIAHLQIVGNEDLYGKNYIVEPRDEQEMAEYNGNESYGGQPTIVYNEVYSPVIVNVWMWPSIQYIYASTYVCYNSPCYYNSYPTWWAPWQPIVYINYWNNMVIYQMPYHLVHKNRLIVALNIYHAHKKESTFVHNNIYNGPRTGDGKTSEPKQLALHSTAKHFNLEPKMTETHNAISSNSYTEPKHQTSYNVSSNNSYSEPKHQSIPYGNNSNSYSEPKHQTVSYSNNSYSEPKHIVYHNASNVYNEPKHVEVNNGSSFSVPKQQIGFHNSSNSSQHMEIKPQNEFHGGGGRRR